MTVFQNGVTHRLTSNPKMKILFVCLGNICRSPLAEGIMRHKLKEQSIDIEVDSAGIGGWQAGEPPDKRAIAIASKNGVEVSNIIARKFSVDDFEKFDKIYVMDLENKRDVMVQAPNENAKQKVDLFLNVLHPSSNAIVPDPWFGDSREFEEVFQLISKGCDAIIEELKK